MESVPSSRCIMAQQLGSRQGPPQLVDSLSRSSFQLRERRQPMQARSSRKPRSVIVDDEPLARLKLHDLVAAVPLVEIVGEANDGEEALRLIDEERPEIVFLDIEMPGLDGLGLLERLHHQPAIIFTTAHSEYAVDAFELAAVDYLVKPFGRERFRRAVERTIRALESGHSGAGADAEGMGYVERLFVRDRTRIVPLSTGAVIHFEARGDYIVVMTSSGRYMIRGTMQDLEERLDPNRFIRVHRSWIVNLDQVESFEPYDAQRFLITMVDGKEIVASRGRSRTLREWVAGSGLAD